VCGFAGAGTPTQKELKAKVLSISNLPAGWSVNNSSSTGSGDQGCLSDVRNPPKHGLKASASFAQGNAPILGEVLGAGPGSKATYSTLNRVLSSCKTYTITDNGQSETVHIGAMSFPSVGQQSSAYALTLTSDGINLGGNIVLFKVDGITGAVVYANIGTPNITQTEAFVTEAVAKIEGKPVTVPSSV
jgi:hypothetical protein